MTRLNTRTHRAWARDNPVLADGELVAEKETGRLKIGDGVTRYNLLPFVSADLTTTKLQAKLYDKLYIWEIIPGSDIPAATYDDLGPIAATDENAGGLIGDVAYVISGLVQNTFEMLAREGTPVALASQLDDGATTTYPAGTVVQLIKGNATSYRALVDGAAIFSGDSGDHVNDITVGGDSHTWSIMNAATDWGPTDWSSVPDYWPYIERFDLKNKKWLSRIPLPQPYAVEGGIAGVVNDKLYFGGGDGDDNEGNEFYVYDPADNSITRLADMDGDDYPDYSLYGVLNNTLWYLGSFAAWSYTPGTDAWVSHPYSEESAYFRADQIQGFEIDGKLWFDRYGVVSVFDPETTTVTDKATRGSDGGGPPFLIDGKIHEFTEPASGGAAVYDPASDTWTLRTDQHPGSEVLTNYGTEFVGVTYEGVPYLLSAVEPDGIVGFGVCAMTGATYDTPRSARLQDVKTIVDVNGRVNAALTPVNTSIAQVAASIPKTRWDWIRLIVDVQGWGLDPVVPLNFIKNMGPGWGDEQAHAHHYATGFCYYTNDNQPMTISTQLNGAFEGEHDWDTIQALLSGSMVYQIEIRMVDIDTGAALSYRNQVNQPLWDASAPSDYDGWGNAHALILSQDSGSTPHTDNAGAGGVHLTAGIAYDPVTRRITNKPGYRGRVLWTLLVDAMAPSSLP